MVVCPSTKKADAAENYARRKSRVSRCRTSIFCLSFGAAHLRFSAGCFTSSPGFFADPTTPIADGRYFFFGCLKDRSAHNSNSNMPNVSRKVFAEKKIYRPIIKAIIFHNFFQLNRLDSRICFSSVLQVINYF